jgi:hypothetical protein
MRARTLNMTLNPMLAWRRYAAIAIAGAAAMLVLLFVFAEGVSLIGTDVLPLRNWKRLDSHQMLLRHQLNTLRTGPHVLVFGTSRNNMLSPDYLKRPVLNLNYVYGTPREILKCLRSLDAQQLRNIEKVYMLVDYHTLEKGRYPRELDLSFTAYARDAFNNFTLRRAGIALNTILVNLGMPYPYYVSGNGYVVPANPDASTGFEVAQRFDRNFRLDAADELKELKAFLEQHKIAAVFYTSPLPKEIVQAFGADFIARYTRTLADALGSYYQLIYVPEISDSGRNFSDDSHLNGTGYRKFYLETDWSKFLTTPANAEARVAQLRATLWKN